MKKIDYVLSIHSEQTGQIKRRDLRRLNEWKMESSKNLRTYNDFVKVCKLIVGSTNKRTPLTTEIIKALILKKNKD